MSQYTSMPPPGTYVPPNQNQSIPPQGYAAQHQQQGHQQQGHQQQGHQQPQAQTTYQYISQGHVQPSQSYKASGGTFGQMMNQAVTTGKPMLNKLSKTISSKLGSKQSTPGVPQQIQSYQNYQQHYGQQTQAHSQQQSHTFDPQAQPGAQQSQAPSAYPAHQSSYQQTGYSSFQGDSSAQIGSPTPQTPQTPQTPYNQNASVSQQLYANYNGGQSGQVGNTAGEQHAHAQQGQYNQGQMSHTVVQGLYQQQPLQAQYSGQQMGVVGHPQQSQQMSNPQSPQIPNLSPNSPAPPQSQRQNSHTGSEQSFASTYPPQPQVVPAPAHSYFPNAGTQVGPNSQQWTPMSPTGSEGQNQSVVPPTSISPPPPPSVQSKPPVMSSVSPQQSQSSSPAPQHNSTQSRPPTEFIAELPADMGNLTITQAKPQVHVSGQPPGPGSPYQAYQSSAAPPGPSPPGFTIARRAVSMSNVPFSDPWRFADPLTELPTREFYAIADLLYDAMDRKFEPQNTGLLEASKILKSWIDLTEDAIQLFSYSSYTAFGKMWSLQGIPHVMVPCQPSLSPIWNFTRHSNAHELKLSSEQTQAASYATYMPALNRAGWYKFFFLEMMHGPDNINKLMPALCPETYKPGVLRCPELNKREKAEAPALQARAAEIQSTAINQVCDEVKAAMLAGREI